MGNFTKDKSPYFRSDFGLSISQNATKKFYELTSRACRPLHAGQALDVTLNQCGRFSGMNVKLLEIRS